MSKSSAAGAAPLLAEHTPGPWTWGEDGNLYNAAELAAWNAFMANDMKGDWVGRSPIVQTDGGHYGPYNADRALIAAAPEMLAALVEILEAVRDNDMFRVGQYVTTAIAKTKRETP